MATISTTSGYEFGTFDTWRGYASRRLARCRTWGINVEAGQNTLPTALFSIMRKKRYHLCGAVPKGADGSAARGRAVP